MKEKNLLQSKRVSERELEYFMCFYFFFFSFFSVSELAVLCIPPTRLCGWELYYWFWLIWFGGLVAVIILNKSKFFWQRNLDFWIFCLFPHLIILLLNYRKISCLFNDLIISAAELSRRQEKTVKIRSKINLKTNVMTKNTFCLQKIAGILFVFKNKLCSVKFYM